MSFESFLKPDSTPTSEYRFMQELIAKVAEYRAEGGQADVHAFGSWLVASHHQPETAFPFLSPGESVESATSKYVIYLYRYAKGYGRKLLKDTPLSSIDDVPYLLMLFFQGPTSKMELIQKNVHEKTTGMEILNRLMRLGLIEQYSNPDDKRSRKLVITATGRGLTLGLMEGMNRVSRIVSGRLGASERSALLHILHKLSSFHEEVHAESRDAGLEEIERRFLI